jgi:hypothetical protein
MKFGADDGETGRSILGIIQQKLKQSQQQQQQQPPHQQGISELLSSIAGDNDIRNAESTFTPRSGRSKVDSLLGLSASSHRSKKSDENNFAEPAIDELFLLERILAPNRKSDETPQRGEILLLQHLEKCKTLDALLDYASQGTSWYFQTAQGQQQRAQANHSVMNGSSYLGSISHTQQPSTISIAPTHVPHTIGASPVEISLLRLTLVCDALFLFVLHSNAILHHDAEDDDTLLRRRTSSRLRSASRASAEMQANRAPRTVQDWQRIATRIASLVMLTSDAQEDEHTIRRCGLSLTGALSQVLRLCVADSDAPVFVPDMLYTQQIHRHCPTHFVLMSVARSVLAAAHAQQRELRREHSAAGEGSNGRVVELETIAASGGIAGTALVENAQHLLQVLATSRAARCVLQDTLYIRTFGDPCGVYSLLTSLCLAPAVCSFVDAVSVDFWRRCEPSALQSYTWALVELMPVVGAGTDSQSKAGGSLGDGGRMTMLTFLETEVFVSHDVSPDLETPASPNTPQRLPDSANDHWAFLGAWLALQASLMMEPSTAMLSSEHAAIRTAMRLGSLHQQGLGVVEQLTRVTIRTMMTEHETSAPAFEPLPPASSSSTWFNNPDLSHLGGPSSVDHDTALSMLLLVDAFLWTIEGQSSPSARQLLHDKVHEASQQHVHLSSLFQNIAHSALSVQALQTSSPPLLSNTPMAVALRCIGRHYPLLSDGATLPVLEYLVCDDVMRRLAATPTTAEASVHPMLLTAALVSNSPADTFAGVVAPVLRTLSLGTMHQQSYLLPLATRALLANTWLRVVSHAAQGCLNEFNAAVNGGTESHQMLSLTLLNEVANILVLSLYFDEQGVATLGTDPVCVVMLDCLRLLTALSAAGDNADAIVRHEMLWNGEPLSLFHVILALAFESHDSNIVEAATALVVDALEHYQVCDAKRHAIATSDDAALGPARPLLAIRRANSGSLMAVHAKDSSHQKPHIALNMLTSLSEDHQTLSSVPRLLILKAMIIYDTPLFDFLFPPPAAVRGNTAKEPQPMSPIPTNNFGRTVLVRLLRDTLQDATTFSARDRAEALELIRRIGPIHYTSAPSTNPPPPLNLVGVVTASRASDAVIAPQQDHTAAQEEVVEAVCAEFSPSLLDNALLVSAAVRFAAQEMANAVVSHGSNKASSGHAEGTSSKPRVPAMSPLTAPAKEASSSTTSATRCPAVVNHAQHLDEVFRRATSITDTIIPVATSLAAACVAELEALDGPLYLGNDYVIRRVRLHYGDAFAFTPLTTRAAPVCVVVNRLASALDVLTELSESVESLFLAVYRDYSSGAKLVELATNALSTFLALLSLCSPVHPSLGWYSGRLLHAVLRNVTSITGCIRTELDRVSAAPQRPGSLLPTAAVLRLSDLFRRAYDSVLSEPPLLHRDDTVGTLLIVASALADVLRSHHAIGNTITVKSFTIPTPVELMTRAVQLRSSPKTVANHTDAPTLSLEFLDCLMTGIAAYGGSMGPLQSFTIARCLWQALHARLHNNSFLLSEPTSNNINTLILCRLLDVLTTLVVHGPEGTCLNLPVDELLQAVSLLGSHDAVALGGFTKDVNSAAAVELGWYSVWRGFLALLRGMVLRLPHDANEWLDAVVSCLSTSPRFQCALCGPQRPQAPPGLASAAAAADYEATVIVGELREAELAAQLLSCAAVASSSSSHQRRHSTRVFAAIETLVDYLCIGFAVLRKPTMILSMVRRPTTVGCTDSRRDAELACASIVQDHLAVLSWWCAESEDWLLADFQPVRGRGQMVSQAKSKFAESIGISDWPAVAKSLFSLEALRDFLVSQFTAVKKIHRDAPFTPSVSSAHPPSTPHLLATSLSPSLRAQLNNGDGAESVVDSEASYSQPGDHPRSLQIHVQSIKVAVHLFVRAVQVRSKVHTNAGASWSGPARDTAEKLEWNLKSFASDLRSYDSMQELSAFLEQGRLLLDGILHRSANVAAPEGTVGAPSSSSSMRR